jgi:2-polyprenyl-3-methyl-5-hydroxy-6-metoxy-1,4-benzoquinol methylase
MAEQSSTAEKSSADEDQIAALPDYGPSYFQNYWGGGGPYERNERWLEFFASVADGIVRDLHPAATLDAGCAMGFLVEALAERGVDAHGIDISEYAISEVDESVRDRCEVRSLTEQLPGRYDLITCIEVVEHVPQAEAETVIANLCRATDQLLLSTTPQDFGEPTHLNVQPPEYWTALLAGQGFVREVERDFSYLSPWAGLYRRVEEPLAETVRRYDRAWWQLRREVTEVRASLLKTREELAAASGQIDNRSELEAELDRKSEEVLRLRDLLIGRDAELGALHGQLAVAHHRSLHLAGISAKLQARLSLVTRLLGMAKRLIGRA